METRIHCEDKRPCWILLGSPDDSVPKFSLAFFLYVAPRHRHDFRLRVPFNVTVVPLVKEIINGRSLPSVCVFDVIPAVDCKTLKY